MRRELRRLIAERESLSARWGVALVAYELQPTEERWIEAERLGHETRSMSRKIREHVEAMTGERVAC